MSSCPNPNDSAENVESKDAPDQRVAVKRSLRWGLICQGAFATIVMGFTLVPAAGIFYGMTSGFCAVNETTMSLIMSGVAIICFLAVGFIIGTKAGYRGALHGMLSGSIAGIGIVIFSVMGMLNDGVGAGWIILTLTVEFLLSLGFGALGGFWGERSWNR